MTLVWLSHPVLWHSSRVPSYNFSAMTTEQAELVVKKWHFVRLLSIFVLSFDPRSPSTVIAQWYEADYDYGRTTVYFFCVGIALFGLFNLFFRLRQRARCVRESRFLARVLADNRAPSRQHRGDYPPAPWVWTTGRGVEEPRGPPTSHPRTALLLATA